MQSLKEIKVIDLPEYALICFAEKLKNMVEKDKLKNSEAVLIASEILDPIEDQHEDLCNDLYDILI